MEPRAYESGAAGTPPSLSSTAVVGFPRTATASLPATTPGPYWFYAWGEEMRNAIIGGGIVPSPYDNGQLLKALMNARLSGH
jgi:hypothetical protein